MNGSPIRSILQKGIPAGVWLVLIMGFVTTRSLSAATFDNFIYSDNGTTITITGCVASPVGAVTIPSEIIGKPVTSISYSAFSGCSNLTGVSIPATVTSIYAYAFYGCSSLGDISVDDANPVYSSNNGVLFDKQQASLIQYPGGRLGDYAVPSTVTSLVPYAFAGCSGLTGISIPNSVTEIGSGVFTTCINLVSVTLPSSVTTLGDYVFQQCSGLTSITLPSNLTSIGTAEFSGCVSLSSILIPSSVTSIGVEAFYGCSGLTSVSIPASVTNLAPWSFNNCTQLTAIYFQGNAPAVVGLNAFYGNDNLIVYYPLGSSGWGSTLGGFPTAPYSLALYHFHSANGLSLDGLQDILAPTGDGVPNLYKYAFNMIGMGPGQAASLSIPNAQRVTPSGSAGLPLADCNGAGETRFTWTYVRRKASTNPGITYLVEFTDDLASPSWATNPSATEDVTSIDADFERVVLTDSVANASKRFSRVRVTSP